MTPDEEMRVIKQVLDGDKDAIEQLVLENQKNVYNLALKMTKNKDDALDISQEAFIKAYTQLESFRGESRFSVWLYRLTYNLCIDFLRRKPGAAALSLTPSEDDGESGDIDIPDMSEQPEDVILRRELRKTIADSIDELDPNHREILIMREITGMSYTEIASALRISEGTVKSRLARARNNLVNILEKKEHIPKISVRIRGKG